MTSFVESLLAERVGGPVSAGDQLVVDVDHVYIQDGNAPSVARLYQQYEFKSVFDPAKISVVFDHAVLAPDSQMAGRLVDAKKFASAHGLELIREGAGISHLIGLEQGWFSPGGIVVGADSHTCTGGVMQALALGMGASDIVAAMETGKIWIKVPETRQIAVRGLPGRAASAKDVALLGLGKFPMEEFIYHAIEWSGEWAEGLSTAEAITISNLGVEFGAKCSFLPPGPGRPAPPLRAIPRRSDCLDLDVSGLPPMIATPGSPSNVLPLDSCNQQPLDYVFLGTCTNGQKEDLQRFVSGLAGRKVASNVHCVVVPGSRRIYRDALREGLIERLLESDAVVSPPGCGPCVGTQGSIPWDGARVLSTGSRNFRGRMGNPAASIWLSSPFVAGHAAALGRLPREDELL
jgi:3-isopropylmalate/(R)-2-methylmalate dehydratase large subunit